MSRQPRRAASPATAPTNAAGTAAQQPQELPADQRADWRARGQPWRTEPEPPADRLRFLTECRAVSAEVAQSRYPFGGIVLTRADVEWLLASHDDGRGPVDPHDAQQRERPGLDLRGADLRGADLSRLPLAHLRAGLTEDEWRVGSAEHLEAAAIHLERADLTGADLSGAVLEGAHLEAARFGQAGLHGANLSFALAEDAYFSEATLDDATLLGASLTGAILTDAHLTRVVLRNASLAGADLSGAHLEAARLSDAHLAGKALSATELTRVRRVRPDFREVLPGAVLYGAFFDAATALDDAALGHPEHGCVCLADLRWGDVNLAVVDWGRVPVLGDELLVTHSDGMESQPPDHETWLRECAAAVRANRQLAVALQAQGLDEDAARYAYRAQLLQRRVLGRQLRTGSIEKLGPWLFSWILYLLGGYGYRMWRILAAYAVVVGLAAVAYYLFGLREPHHLSWSEALLDSITAFHGRVFSGQFAPDSPQAWVTALEAISGLIVESIFVAMLVQKFFGR
jgi:uncharacterized protein YjbI with pentapeptide repeats